MHTVATVQWEVVVSDVQGKLSNLFLWPGTLTCACLKRKARNRGSKFEILCLVQVIRGDVVEHQEVTPFYEVVEYEVKCNYRCTVDVPVNCSHIHLFFISGDIHPVSNKPKLIARASKTCHITVNLNLESQDCLSRIDRVTENCIPGGYVRLGVFRKCRETDEGSTGDRASFDQVSVCSSARDPSSPFHPFETELNSLPPRPASAVPRMLISEDIQGVSDSDEAIDSKSVFATTERSYVESPRREAHILGVAGGSGVDQQTQTNEEESKPSEDSRSLTHERSGLHMKPWFGLFFGATLGVLSTVAAFTLRYLSRRNSRKRRAEKKNMICT